MLDYSSFINLFNILTAKTVFDHWMAIKVLYYELLLGISHNIFRVVNISLLLIYLNKNKESITIWYAQVHALSTFKAYNLLYFLNLNFRNVQNYTTAQNWRAQIQFMIGLYYSQNVSYILKMSGIWRVILCVLNLENIINYSEKNVCIKKHQSI